MIDIVLLDLTQDLIDLALLLVRRKFRVDLSLNMLRLSGGNGPSLNIYQLLSNG